jgi:hypothetical protein
VKTLSKIGTGLAVLAATSVPAFAQEATETAMFAPAETKVGVVAAAVLGFIGVVALASLGIEFALKGMQKSKQVVKRL